MHRFFQFLLLVILVIAGGLSSPAQRRNVPRGLAPFVGLNADSIVLAGVDVIDGTGGPVRRNYNVVLRGDEIAAVGPAASTPPPEGATVVSLSGHTVMPGYVMLHEHLFYPAGNRAYNSQSTSFPPLYLAGGATTIRTGGSMAPYLDLNLKAAVDRGELPGPRIHVTGPYLNGPGLPIQAVKALRGVEDARRMVRYWSDEGATSFKAYMHISRAELAAAIEQAHALGHKVTAHLCSVTYREAARMGIDNLEHGFLAATDFVPDRRPDRCPSGRQRDESMLNLDPEGEAFQGLVQELLEAGVAVTSTLTVFETSVPGRPRAPKGALEAMLPEARELYLRGWDRVAAQQDSVWSRLWPKAMALEKAFADAGGLLVAGTDPTGYGGVVAGYANQRQIELLVEAGFNPETAVQIATSNGARYLEVDDRLGTVEAGKLADLVVVEGDVSTDVSSVRNTIWVFKGGLGYDSRALFDSVKGTVGLR